MNKETFTKIMQFVKFGIVGVSNNVIFYIVNISVLWLLKNKEFVWDYVAANIAGFLVSVLWSFYWNNKYVFKADGTETRSAWKTLLKTYMAYGFTGIILNNVLSYLWIEMLGLSKYIAPLINLFITVPVNFILNKLWAFRTIKTEEKYDSSKS
jgi:putative flippase GtrA